MKRVFLLICISYCTAAFAQSKKYSVANAHSHNDYAQKLPFTDAYNHGFGSMEADIFLLKDSDTLWVAHNLKDIESNKRNLDQLYLLPLVNAINSNKGTVYSNSKKSLQILIDIKSEAVPTLDQLIKIIKSYPSLTNNPMLTFTISGERPDPSMFSSYPSFIEFDGVIGINYSETALSRIVMMSAPFQQFSKWSGQGAIPMEDSLRLLKVIEDNHKLGKRVRLWAAPDNPDTWKQLMKLGVDFINTDKISELAEYLKK